MEQEGLFQRSECCVVHILMTRTLDQHGLQSVGWERDGYMERVKEPRVPLWSMAVGHESFTKIAAGELKLSSADIILIMAGVGGGYKS